MLRALWRNRQIWQLYQPTVASATVQPGFVSDQALGTLIRADCCRLQSLSTSADFAQTSAASTATAAPSEKSAAANLFPDQEPIRTATASFGYQDVPTSEKTSLVGQVFSSVASSYDLMNDLMSVGMHRLWKDKFVRELKPFAGMQHLDVAGGTGDIAFRVLDQITQQEEDQAQDDESTVTPAGSVVVCDINPDMLSEGMKKAQAAGHDSRALEFVEGNAEQLPFQDHSFDAYTIAFGIRNVTDIPAALQEAHRVLKVGGRFLCLEFSQVVVPGLKQAYDAYSFNVIPELGRVVANDRASYEYLVESIREFPDQEAFTSMIRQAGFQNVAYENLQGGIVAIHSGFKL